MCLYTIIVFINTHKNNNYTKNIMKIDFIPILL